MKIFIDGVDKRFDYVKKLLKENGYTAESIRNNEFLLLKKPSLILMSPAFKFKDCEAKKIPNNSTIICGNVDSEIQKIFVSNNIKYINIMKDEDFVLKNASLTAENLLVDLISQTPKSIYEQNILLLGGGRVATAIALLFSKMNIPFDITMRDENKLNLSKLVANQSLNWQSFKENLNDYDVIINTIPFKLFDEIDLPLFKTNSTVFELASKKCLENLNSRDFKYVLCPALPSKYSPDSAGQLIFDFVSSKLKELI